MESAMLKESHLLIGRNAVADHSPNAGRVRLIAYADKRIRLAPDSESQALSVAAQKGVRRAFSEPAPTPGQPDIENGRFDFCDFGDRSVRGAEHSDGFNNRESQGFSAVL
jgi:hypothetical protein